jgi:hypothetical protein
MYRKTFYMAIKGFINAYQLQMLLTLEWSVQDWSNGLFEGNILTHVWKDSLSQCNQCFIQASSKTWNRYFMDAGLRQSVKSSVILIIQYKNFWNVS